MTHEDQIDRVRTLLDSGSTEMMVRSMLAVEGVRQSEIDNIITAAKSIYSEEGVSEVLAADDSLTQPASPNNFKIIIFALAATFVIGSVWAGYVLVSPDRGSGEPEVIEKSDQVTSQQTKSEELDTSTTELVSSKSFPTWQCTGDLSENFSLSFIKSFSPSQNVIVDRVTNLPESNRYEEQFMFQSNTGTYFWRIEDTEVADNAVYKINRDVPLLQTFTEWQSDQAEIFPDIAPTSTSVSELKFIKKLLPIQVNVSLEGETEITETGFRYRNKDFSVEMECTQVDIDQQYFTLPAGAEERVDTSISQVMNFFIR